MCKVSHAYDAFQDHAELVAYDAIEWADAGMRLPSCDLWPRAQAAPKPGTQMQVRVCPGGRRTAIGSGPWILFRPGMGVAICNRTK